MQTDSSSPNDPLSLRGLWVPVITPFESRLLVDEHSLRLLATRLLTNGVRGLVALGTTGEPATLSRSERLQVVRTVGLACAEMDRPLIVGVGSNSTDDTIEEIFQVVEVGQVAAALVVVPYYTRPSEQAVVEHFHLVADASPVPLVAYNIPYRTGRGMGSDALLAIASHPNIVGLKQSVESLDHDTLALLRSKPTTFEVLAGDDAFIAPTIMMGGAGAISASAHVCTPLFVEMVDAALAGNTNKARQVAEILLPVIDAGFHEPSPAVWKGALANDGEISTPELRRPMTMASMRATRALSSAIDMATRLATSPGD